ncbi:MAG: glycerate kinase [Nitrospirota bacterium]
MMERLGQSKIVVDIFNYALNAVDPYNAVMRHLSLDREMLSAGDKDYPLKDFKRIIVIGAGKASARMASAVETVLGERITDGIVITKYGYNREQDSRGKGQGARIRIFEAGHPIPDENGLKATQEIIKLLKDSDENTLVLCLISGGGSALFVSPYDWISLVEKQKITNMLLMAGANINELNTVRKHISRVKGGRLAEIAYPATIISLILSDVVGDRLDVIASGTTSPDKTTYQDALGVLKKYGLIDRSPQTVLKVLYEGTKGLIPETPKEGDIIFEKVENIIIGSNEKALGAAKTRAETLGLNAEIISKEISGEARDVGRWLAQRALVLKGSRVQGFRGSSCLISGGETTVTVKGNGLGGRNMELALAFAMEIEGVSGITLLSAGTDGTDGTTDAAGAIVDGNTVAKAKAIVINPEEYLRNNDSYNFFKKINGLFVTGPTGTNVMDMQIIIVVESQ